MLCSKDIIYGEESLFLWLPRWKRIQFFFFILFFVIQKKGFKSLSSAAFQEQLNHTVMYATDCGFKAEHRMAKVHRLVGRDLCPHLSSKVIWSLSGCSRCFRVVCGLGSAPHGLCDCKQGTCRAQTCRSEFSRGVWEGGCHCFFLSLSLRRFSASLLRYIPATGRVAHKESLHVADVNAKGIIECHDQFRSHPNLSVTANWF